MANPPLYDITDGDRKLGHKERGASTPKTSDPPGKPQTDPPANAPKAPEPAALTAKRKQLLTAQDAAIASHAPIKSANEAQAKQYDKKVGQLITFCNLATYEIAKATGVPLAPLEYSPGIPQRADPIADKLAEVHAANGLYQKVSQEEGIKLANAGEFVLAVMKKPAADRSGHLATLRPQAPDSQTVMVANVGKTNGVMKLSEAFGKSAVVSFYSVRRPAD
jgi:hypothetical protein